MKNIIIGRTYTDGVDKAFTQLGFNVIKADYAFEDKEESQIKDYIMLFTGNHKIEYLFTIDFFPNVAEVCHDMNIKYISWVWDCPHSVLWAKVARYNTNYIFLFDNDQYQMHVERGLKNVYYLPIAPDVAFFSNIISNDSGKSEKIYSNDVVFVGNFYDGEEYDIFSQVKYLPEYTKGYLDSAMNVQKMIWGEFLLSKCISESVWSSLKQYIRWDLGDRYEQGIYEITMLNFMAQKIARQERIDMCTRINEQFDFGLYTGSNLKFSQALTNKGYASYKTQMPLIFRYSKININITLRSITSGIPLRVMDILACGGFLITNYQPEIAYYFEDGVDLVFFSDFDDLLSKIDYYLNHDEERRIIAKSGFEKVSKQFELQKQINVMMDTIENNGR